MNDFYLPLLYFLINNGGLLAHAIPDFIVWFFFATENPEWKWARTFRVCKWIYDFVITGTLAIMFLPWDIVMWFYILKWWHGADSWYNIFSKWFGKQVGDRGYWRFWTPLGLTRSEFFYHDTMAGWRSTLSIAKGNVTRNEAYLQTIIAEILFIIYLLLKHLWF